MLGYKAYLIAGHNQITLSLSAGAGPVLQAAALVLGFALAFLIAMEERALRRPVTQKQATPAPASPIAPVSAE